MHPHRPVVAARHVRPERAGDLVTEKPMADAVMTVMPSASPTLVTRGDGETPSGPRTSGPRTRGLGQPKHARNGECGEHRLGLPVQQPCCRPEISISAQRNAKNSPESSRAERVEVSGRI